jgi:hypothetical protein
VRDLDAGDDEVGRLGQQRVVAVRPGQGPHLRGEVPDEGRLEEGVLRQLLEQLERDRPGPHPGCRATPARSAWRRSCSSEVAVVTSSPSFSDTAAWRVVERQVPERSTVPPRPSGTVVLPVASAASSTSVRASSAAES